MSLYRINPRSDGSTTRASVTFPNDLYETLESLAKFKKVSLAWIVREAAERYAQEEGSSVSKRQENQ